VRPSPAQNQPVDRRSGFGEPQAALRMTAPRRRASHTGSTVLFTMGAKRLQLRHAALQ
jgi:hypothetical protein